MTPGMPEPTRAAEPRHVTSSLRAACRDEQIIVVANRQPLRHDYHDGRIVPTRSHSGVVHAVEPLLAACSGVWVAHGAGTADRDVLDEHDGLLVPPDHPAYRLRRVWLTPDEEAGYYDGFSNEALWPLCHRAYVKPTFRSADYEAYDAVNQRFANAVAEEATSRSPLVLVQDYHFALVPRQVRNRLPASSIITFWHVPWPHADDFEICPWATSLLAGLLGSTIVGFQTPDDGLRFLNAVERSRIGTVNYRQQTIAHAGRTVLVRAYPASVQWPSAWAAGCPSIDECRRDVRRRLHLQPDVQVGIGVDRLDYTKGLEEKFQAIERLLDLHADYRRSFVFVQLAQPTRARLAAYRELRPRLVASVDRINERFGTSTHRPIVLVEGDHEPAEVFRYLRAADLCYVGSLQDGMNLVSKEFVSARDDCRGVLVLSRAAGAAVELRDALLVNPWDIDGTADALRKALQMSESEQQQRMRGLRSAVAGFSAECWAEQMITDALQLRTESIVRHEGVQSAPAGGRTIVAFERRRSHATL